MEDLTVSKKRILFVRHGKTEWNGQSRFQGKTDVPLDGEGMEQASRLASRLEGWGPFQIVSSPLLRAWQTAETIASRYGETVPQKMECLSEMGFGAWEGRSILEIESGDPEAFRLWKRNPFENIPPGGESFQNVSRRVGEFLESLLAREGDRFVVVSHGGIIRAALVLLLGLPLGAVWRMKISNCSVTGVDAGKKGASLIFLNDEIHILLPPEAARSFPFSS